MSFQSALPCLLAVALCASSFAVEDRKASTIGISGEAEIRLAADELVIQASIESVGKTAVDACRTNREKSSKLAEFLKSQNIPEQWIDIDLVSVRVILPESSGRAGKDGRADVDPFQDGPGEQSFSVELHRRAIGYVASRRFTIVVKDFSKFEAIYQGMVDQGVNRIDQVSYRSTKEKESREQVVLMAVRAAKARGQAMAQELGAGITSIQSVGDPKISIGNNGRGGYGGMGMGDPFGGEEVPHTNSQIVLRATVFITFELEEGHTKNREGR